MGATVICKGCGTEMYKRAKKCPQCGRKNKNSKGLIIVGVIILLVIISVVVSKIKGNQAKKITYQWPQTGVAALLPQPDLKYGKITRESEDSFSMTLYFVSEKNFQDYVEACRQNGFVVDYVFKDTRFDADDAEGNSLVLSYSRDDKEMDIDVSAYVEPAPKVEETEASEEAETSGAEESDETEAAESGQSEADKSDSADAKESSDSPTTQEAAAKENDADFRTWVDGYEAFMNKYVDFMVKYSNSNGTDLSLIANYADMISEYAQWMSETSEIDADDLSVDDYVYYTEAQARIYKRLAEIQ
jgi:hypothetical protein